MRHHPLIAAITSLALMALACQTALGLVGISKTPTPAPTAPTAQPPSPEPAITALFEDDFSDPSSGWTVDSGDYGSRGYEGGEYVIRSTKAGWWVWGLAHQALSNVDLHVTARPAGAAADDSFGILRNYQDADNYYVCR